jgi:hypothetical protein
MHGTKNLLDIQLVCVFYILVFRPQYVA